MPTSVGATRSVVVRRAQRELDGFDEVRLVGRRHGGTTLVAYDVGSGVLLSLAGLVKLLVNRDGTEIEAEVSPHDPTAVPLAAGCTVNLGMSVCTLLQGGVPLHGCSVQLNGALICVSALSGTGKSTLLWSLVDRGARFAADDVLTVRAEGGRVIGWPSVSLHAKLSAAALERRGMDTAGYDEVVPGSGEYWLPVAPEDRCLEPLPLGAVVCLAPYPPGCPGPTVCNRLAGGAAVMQLMEHVQGLWAVYSMLDARRFLEHLTAIAAATPVYQIRYVRRFEALPQLAEIIGRVAASEPRAAARAKRGAPTAGRWRLPWRSLPAEVGRLRAWRSRRHA
jgi:hypothetical protein